MGSRIPLQYAQESGANFLTQTALDAVRTRTATVEPHQTLDHQRIWADLLWSPALAFNLFGDLASDLRLADRCIRSWWPDTPGTVSEVRFAHSPGRLDPAYLNSLRAFDAAFILDCGDGTHGIIAVATKYHDWAKPETPKPENRARYLQVAERSHVFRPAAPATLTGRSGLAVTWLEHLLLLSMLQHPSKRWRWGRYLIVRPEGNVSFAHACATYSGLLTDSSTFASITLEDLLQANALPKRTNAPLKQRYLLA